MRCLFQIVIVIASCASFGSQALAQDHVIRKAPAANRVIQLRSSANPSQSQPSRAVRTAQNTGFGKATSQYDGNRASSNVPNSLKSINVPPRVAEQSRSTRKMGTARPAAPQTGLKSNTSNTQLGKYRAARPAQPIAINKSTPAINTSIEVPKYINLNQPATLRIKLKNVSNAKAKTVKLIATLPPHAKFERSTPMPSHTDGNRYEFHLSNLAGQQVREVAIVLIPTEKKPLEIGTEVVIENVQSFAVGVRQPKIKLSLQGPTEANLGQKVSHKVLLENTGDGMATNIQLLANFPTQLTCSKKHQATIPTLEPGQSVIVEMPSMAIKAGEAQLKVDVTATGVDAQTVNAAIRVFQPELEVTALGPEMNFVNREGMVTIKLDNKGEVDATDVKIQLEMPAGMQVTTISRKAKVDSKKGVLTWTFDRIAAKTEQTIMLKTTATQPGQQTCNVTVQSKETRDKQIQLTTMVATRADLSVAVTNQSGPIKVGGKAQFSVVVENRGSSSANDVAVNIELPESLTPLQQDGIDILGFGNAIHFEDARIEPGQKREFVFSATSTGPGEHVVRSVLQAGGSERQIITEGSVYVYEVSQSRISEALTPAVPR